MWFNKIRKGIINILDMMMTNHLSTDGEAMEMLRVREKSSILSR